MHAYESIQYEMEEKSSFFSWLCRLYVGVTNLEAESVGQTYPLDIKKWAGSAQ